MALSFQDQLTLVGLSLNLFGGILLFFFVTPKKQIGNAVLDGETMYQLDDPKLRHVQQEEWGPKFNAAMDRAKILTRVGFGLLVIGALLQIVAFAFKA